MPRKIKDVTRATLVSVPLPTHADTYTVISHDSIINYAFAELTANGFGVMSEEYRSTLDGQIAQGIYKLQYNSDPEMSLMFAWSNSYNKQMRFKCAVGGYVHSNQTVMISGEMGSYSRKHTGTADQDTIATMSSQIVSAKMYYDQLVLDKEMMKSITLSKRKQAELLGILFAEYEILTTEQASMIRQQMAKPTFFYNGGLDTLWAFYNHVTVALQNSHPRTWMEDQRMLHWFISNEFDLLTPVIALPAPDAVIMPSIAVLDPLAAIPNQTNILDQIAEIEAIEDAVIYVESDQEYLERVAEIEGEPEVENVIYTDPAGNTFEVPMIKESVIPVVETEMPQEIYDALINAPETDASEVDMSKVTWVDAPEVAPARVKFAIDDTEVPSLTPTPEEHAMLEAEDATPDDFGFEMDFSTVDNDEEDDEDDVDHDFFL